MQDHPWLAPLARLGHAAKGMVYLLVGWRTIEAGLLLNRPAGNKGALSGLHKVPYGDPLLLALAFGLACFALWRAAQVFLDAEEVGSDWKGVASRVGFAISGLVYGNLAAGALELALERPEPEDAAERHKLAAFLLEQPLGQALLASLGVAILGLGLAQIARARWGKFLKPLHIGDMSTWERRAVVPLAYLGLCSRGLVFSAVGIFVMRAAWEVDPKQVQSTQELMLALRKLSYGPPTLIALGTGLIAYGVFMGVEARYRQLGKLDEKS